MDSSGSVRDDYSTQKDFIKKLSRKFFDGKQKSKVGVITFSYRVRMSVKLSDHANMAAFSRALDSIPLMGATTRIDKALRLAQRDFFREENGGRGHVPDLLVLLTDGSQTKTDSDWEDPAEIADELRNAGIR